MCPVPAALASILAGVQRPFIGSSCRRSWTASSRWPASWRGGQRSAAPSRLPVCLSGRLTPPVCLSVCVSLQDGDDGLGGRALQSPRSAGGAGWVTAAAHRSPGPGLVPGPEEPSGSPSKPRLPSLWSVLSSAHYEQIQMCEDAAVCLLCIQLWIQACTSSR